MTRPLRPSRLGPVVLVTTPVPKALPGPLARIARIVTDLAGGDIMPRAEMLRRLPEAARHVCSGRWRKFQPGRWDGALPSGRILGLAGNRTSSRAVAVRTRGFGLKVIYHQRTAGSAPDYGSLDRLLAEADIVSVHIPLNAGSRGLINAARLRRLKRGAWLINMSRGQRVDESALIRALETGRPAGRRMPGWTVGLSPMATLISSFSVLALSEFSCRHDSRFLDTCLVYPAVLAAAVERLAGLRCAAGPAIDIATDSHGRLTQVVAKRLVRLLEPHGRFFVDEPVCRRPRNRRSARRQTIAAGPVGRLRLLRAAPGRLQITARLAPLRVEALSDASHIRPTP